MTKTKNPIAKSLRSPHLRNKIVKPKKGKGAKPPRHKVKDIDHEIHHI